MTSSNPKLNPFSGLANMLRSPSGWFLIASLAAAAYVGVLVPPTWTSEKITLDMVSDAQGRLFFSERGKPSYPDSIGVYADSPLHPDALAELNRQGKEPTLREEVVTETLTGESGEETHYYKLLTRRHWRFWSLLPALVAVVLCMLTREPLTSLFGGILAGALLLGSYDITDAVLVPSLATKDAAGILLLYLWLLGGLMGVWTRTGAARAFAEMMTRHVVRGPKTARLVTWMLGVFFFQGGTISTVLVGTTVKPIADAENISHEELAYLVDSTGSPIASLLPFNAWPAYVQPFIYVAGVSWLATETDRIAFFFGAIPFCFYAIFAVTGTFLLCIDKSPWLGKQMRQAIKRARSTGQLDADGAQPLSAAELHTDKVPPGFQPSPFDFILPLIVLTGIAVGTFFVNGAPQVRWAFAVALLLAMILPMLRGMKLIELMEGFHDGLKGVVLGSVILLLAVTIGGIGKATGGGAYLVALLGDNLPFWLLPILLQLLTIVISFSTGTSWGTLAVAFPLAMPLSWAIAQSQGLDHPQFYMTICFAAVLDGSVFGDQCSPISDTTVLSAMCTGCDLLDHVKTQIPQASMAAALAAVCWTGLTWMFA